MTEKLFYQDNPIYRQKEQELELQKLCQEVLASARNELYLHMRFLDVALSSLVFCTDERYSPAGTDGITLFYESVSVLTLYRSDRRRLNRLYLHMIIHCLFGHLFLQREREEKLWNIACDIGAEFILDGLEVSCIHQSKSPFRRGIYQKLQQQRKVVTVPGIYHWLESQALSAEELQALQLEFCMDDHGCWGRPENKPKQQERQKHWDEVRDHMQTEMETFSKEAAEDAQSLYEQVCVENRQKYDYKKFLEKFCVLKEEMMVDLDAFDYIFYNYGMELYGNMPLVEPQETREIHRIEEFVVVIDTSMSCKGELVKRFLEETYSVLKEGDRFSRKIHIHLIQCDDKVQRDTLITKREQLESYMKNFQVVGQGGTDFRPAFVYVNQLVQQRVFHHLRGLIYFTDGYGSYPVKKPNYETAFVFVKEDYQDVDVPPWAIKLILDGEDYEY